MRPGLEGESRPRTGHFGHFQHSNWGAYSKLAPLLSLWAQIRILCFSSSTRSVREVARGVVPCLNASFEGQKTNGSHVLAKCGKMHTQVRVDLIILCPRSFLTSPLDSPPSNCSKTRPTREKLYNFLFFIISEGC